jgi:hypothetical protein
MNGLQIYATGMRFCVLAPPTNPPHSPPTTAGASLRPWTALGCACSCRTGWRRTARRSSTTPGCSTSPPAPPFRAPRSLSLSLFLSVSHSFPPFSLPFSYSSFSYLILVISSPSPFHAPAWKPVPGLFFFRPARPPLPLSPFCIRKRPAPSYPSTCLSFSPVPSFLDGCRPLPHPPAPAGPVALPSRRYPRLRFCLPPGRAGPAPYGLHRLRGGALPL